MLNTGRIVFLAIFAARTVDAQMPTWVLQPDLSIGGEESGPRSFGDVRGVVANSRGDIIVL
jgi:hypothetical protein